MKTTLGVSFSAAKIPDGQSESDQRQKSKNGKRSMLKINKLEDQFRRIRLNWKQTFFNWVKGTTDRRQQPHPRRLLSYRAKPYSKHPHRDHFDSMQKRGF